MKNLEVMKKLMISALMLSGVLLLSNCSDDENNKVKPNVDTPFINEATAETYKGTQSPGDVWTWSLDKEQGHMTATWDYGTFDDSSDDITIEGTFETLPSGYLKVTIVDTEPANDEIPTDGTAWFYALEIPNMAMVVKPEGSIKGDIIAMVAEGDCATIEGAYNYVISAPGNGKDFDPVTEEAFGYAEFTDNGSGFDVNGYKFSLDCINGACSDTGPIEGLPVATCDNGGFVSIADASGTQAQGQFTQSGAMMMDFGYGNGGVFATKTTESATKDAFLDNTYLGIAYIPSNNDEKTVPIKAEFFNNDLDNMVGVATPFTDIENNILDSNEGATILVDNVVNGRVYGTLDFGEGYVAEMAAALGIQGNDQILILTSYSPKEGNPFILILAKQN